MNNHALLSPSGAERWILCPGSIALTKDIPDISSPYAEEGTLLHAHSAHRLNPALSAPIAGLDEEQESVVAAYVAFVTELSSGAVCLVEQRVSVGHWTGEEGAEGTADALAQKGNHLWVVDFKAGRGVAVSPEDNPQLMMYALGALHDHPEWEIEDVTLAIHQPRISSEPLRWATTVSDLEDWAERVLKPKAELAMLCMVTLEPLKEYLHPSEEACRFCRGKASCPALNAEVMAMFEPYPGESLPTNVTAETKLIPAYLPGDLAKAMTLAPLMEHWIKAIRARAEEELLAGREVPGFKLVRGRRGPRQWSDTALTEARLKKMRLKADVIYDRKLASPTTLAKKLGPRRWKTLEGLIVQSEGSLSVAPVSDKRPAVAPAIVCEGDFTPVDPAEGLI